MQTAKEFICNEAIPMLPPVPPTKLTHPWVVNKHEIRRFNGFDYEEAMEIALDFIAPPANMQ